MENINENINEEWSRMTKEEKRERITSVVTILNVAGVPITEKDVDDYVKASGESREFVLECFKEAGVTL